MGSQGASFNPKKNSSDGLVLHCVQGGPIVTLVKLFLFFYLHPTLIGKIGLKHGSR